MIKYASFCKSSAVFSGVDARGVYVEVHISSSRGRGPRENYQGDRGPGAGEPLAERAVPRWPFAGARSPGFHLLQRRPYDVRAGEQPNYTTGFVYDGQPPDPAL